MEAEGGEIETAVPIEWPAAWKLAGAGDGQYTQLALYDSELGAACYCIGVLRRDGESESGAMLAIPAAFMEEECETLCGLTIVSRHPVSIGAARRASQLVDMWLVDMDIAVAESLSRVADLENVSIVDYYWKAGAPSVWPQGKGIKEAVEAWMEPEGRYGGDEDEDRDYVPEVARVTFAANVAGRAAAAGADFGESGKAAAAGAVCQNAGIKPRLLAKDRPAGTGAPSSEILELRSRIAFLESAAAGNGGGATQNVDRGRAPFLSPDVVAQEPLRCSPTLLPLRARGDPWHSLLNLGLPGDLEWKYEVPMGADPQH